MRLPVCSTRYCRPAHAGGEHHEHDERDADHDQRIHRVVDDDFVDHDLGEHRVASAISWIASEASSTSRQIALCLSSSGTNHRKPNCGADSGSAASAASAAACARTAAPCPRTGRRIPPASRSLDAARLPRCRPRVPHRIRAVSPDGDARRRRVIDVGLGAAAVARGLSTASTAAAARSVLPAPHHAHWTSVPALRRR